eukprot:32586-Hanusia_phi.AAC.2
MAIHVPALPVAQLRKFQALLEILLKPLARSLVARNQHAKKLHKLASGCHDIELGRPMTSRVLHVPLQNNQTQQKSSKGL